ncbi:MAG TPA: substrate-binding domain-containing protein [Solirubrobacteraceae bacterium]|jgi:ABC-type phosphate transport system substrate-binding protein|nr:substrate-binding domain-containing protein [Solirubrobacteraceae bacterium]
MVAALAAPGAASAAIGAHCEGANIEAQGASTQKLAHQTVWGPTFNTSPAATACNGTQGSKGTPTVKYNSTGSGAGLKAFGAEGATPDYKNNAFVGTDEAPDAAQKAEIETHAAGAEPKSLETIPVEQVAIAVVMHLPDGCKAENETGVGAYKGRLALNDTTIESIYRGTLTKWSEIKAAGDKLTCTGGKAEEESSIIPVVRKDQSGTSHIFKTFLAAINKTSFTAEAFPVGCPSALPEETKTWAQMDQGCENQRWPTAAKVVHAAAEGGGAVAKEVEKTPSSISYLNLADARSNKSFTPGVGGAHTAKFWAIVQNKTAEPFTYADPATNKDVEKLGNANCSKTVYTDGKTEFPPASTRELWNEAQAALNEVKYPLCGLTYDLALRQYSKYGGGLETSLGEATTVENYLLYAVTSSKEAGSFFLKNHDYEKLPTNVKKLSEKGIKEIQF